MTDLATLESFLASCSVDADVFELRPDYRVALIAVDGIEPGPGDEVVRELREAVFDDPKPVAVLRKTFDPLFFPKPEGAERVENLEKTRGAVRRLEALLQAIEGVDEGRVKTLLPLLAELRAELDAVIPDAKAELGAAKRKAS